MINISRSKDNHAMKFGQFIKYNIRSIFLENDAENGAVRLLPDLFLFFKKLYIRSEQALNNLVLIYFGRPPLGHTIKTNFMTI